MTRVVSFPQPSDQAPAPQAAASSCAAFPVEASSPSVPNGGDSGHLTKAIADINRLGWLAAAQLIHNDDKRAEALKQLAQELGL